MTKKDPYREFLEKDFSDLFQAMDLKDAQRQYMRSRWLDQVLWMEGRASKARDRYYRLRLTSIIGGVIVPILIGLNINDQRVADVLRNVTIGLSTVVAVSAAVEEFFHYGERWRHYRRSVETLKTQGWQFSQLTGPYSIYKNHADGFSIFVSQVEDIIQKDVELYATQITQSNKKDDERDVSEWVSGSYAISDRVHKASISPAATPASISTATNHPPNDGSTPPTVDPGLESMPEDNLQTAAEITGTDATTGATTDGAINAGTNEGINQEEVSTANSPA